MKAHHQTGTFQKKDIRVKNRILALTAVVALAGSAFVQAGGPPNVVLIISDDHHWSEYGFMGHDVIETPNIDKLANESLTFTRGYVPSSLCRPSLASMATGFHPHQHKITGNDPATPGGIPKPPARQMPEYNELRQELISFIDDAPTIPRMLAEEGYLSHQSGKWWEGHYSRGGFTHGMTHGDRSRGGRHGDDGLRIGRDGMEPVFEFIEHARAEDKPFFIWYAPFLPHTPHNPPERLFEKYREFDIPERVARYYAMIEWFDETVGELVGYIDDNGLSEDTMVLYVCDNGWLQMHPQMPIPQNWRQEGYAPRTKRSPYDGGIRTPIMVRWPGKVEPYQDEQTLVSSIDLAPTALAAAGVAPHPRMTGVNLLDSEALESRDAVFGAIFEHDQPVPLDDLVPGLRHRWVVQGDWKLIYPRYSDANLQDVEIELYNIMRDPNERHNLVDEHPRRALQLMRLVDQWWPADE